MQKVFRLTRCPYCHRKISYINASFLKTKGEYSCDSCNCISNVVINRTLYAIASGICILALIIVLMYSSFGEHGSLWGLVFVLIPFVVFYAIVPFFIRLEPCKDKSAVKKIKEKSIKIMPSDTAAEHARSKSVQNTQNPIELDVSADFSAKFMKTKSNLENTRSELSEEEKEQSTDLSEPSEITGDIFSSEAPEKITDETEK